jgi:hypothetical protein
MFRLKFCHHQGENEKENIHSIVDLSNKRDNG